MSATNYDWPWSFLNLDPYEADERAVKRAYAKLLKDNRPDDDSESFMMVRKARDHALEELTWGLWEERPDETDEDEWDDDEYLDDYGDPEWLIGNKPATVWVEDRNTGKAVGIDRAWVFVADIEESRDLFTQSFNRYAKRPDRWKPKQAQALVEAVTHLLGSGSSLTPAIDERQLDRQARSLGYLHWLSWRMNLRENPAQSSLVDDFLAFFKVEVDHYGHDAMPCACLTPSERAPLYDGPTKDHHTVLSVLEAWRQEPSSVSTDSFRSMFARLSENYEEFELRGFPKVGDPPEVLLGAVACLIAQVTPQDRWVAGIAESVEFVQVAADTCGIPLPPWMTLASVSNNVLTSKCTPVIWRIAQVPEAKEALRCSAEWYSGSRKAEDVTPDVVADLLEPVALARRKVAGQPIDDGGKFEIGEDDCAFHHELVNALHLMDSSDSDGLFHLFCASLGLFGFRTAPETSDDVDADPKNNVYYGLLALLDADMPKEAADWETLLDDPSVSDIDGAMDLESWLRETVLAEAGYQDLTIYRIPGFGAAQALLMKDRFGWGEPKSMATWEPEEREAMLKLYDLTRRGHFLKEGETRPPPSERGHGKAAWGDHVDSRLSAENRQEEHGVSEKTEKIVKYFVWAGVVLLLIHLIRLFTGG